MKYLFKYLLKLYDRAGKQERKVIRLALEAIRRVLMYLGDPSYTTEIRGKLIELPISHKLPIYIRDAPLYDALPVRVSDYLRMRDGKLLMIDVGANVGDTILACDKTNIEDKFLGIEANPKFVPYLIRNTEGIRHFALVQAFCYSGSEKLAHIQIKSINGTAIITEENHGKIISKKTLDEVIDEHPEYFNFNFLKLDTDGSDFEILKGGQKSISTNRPIILMEFDVFENVNYVEDCLYAIDSLAKAGYSNVIVYDNLGYIFCNFRTDEPSQFLDAISYQIVSEFGYFDLLFITQRDIDLIESEKEFFSRFVQERGGSTLLKKALRF